MQVQFCELYESQLGSIPITPGTLYTCIDTGNMYLDDSKGVRDIISNEVKISPTELGRTNLVNIIDNKIYVVVESGRQYIHSDNKWIPLTANVKILRDITLDKANWVKVDTIYNYSISDTLIKSWNTTDIIFDSCVRDIVSTAGYLSCISTNGAVNIKMTNIPETNLYCTIYIN